MSTTVSLCDKVILFKQRYAADEEFNLASLFLEIRKAIHNADVRKKGVQILVTTKGLEAFVVNYKITDDEDVDFSELFGQIEVKLDSACREQREITVVIYEI